MASSRVPGAGLNPSGEFTHLTLSAEAVPGQESGVGKTSRELEFKPRRSGSRIHECSSGSWLSGQRGRGGAVTRVGTRKSDFASDVGGPLGPRACSGV